MGTVQVDPAALSGAGEQVRQTALQIDSLRVDLWVGSLNLAEAAGDPTTGASARNFAAAADHYLSAARDGLAGLYEYTLAVASAAMAADGSGSGNR
jgi:hypothetical protein